MGTDWVVTMRRHPAHQDRAEAILVGGWRLCPDGIWRVPGDWPPLVVTP
jgi:hypothetical protein